MRLNSIKAALAELAGIRKQAASRECVKDDTAAALADFVEPYAQSGNKRFTGLYKSLRKGEQPNKADVDSASSFLKKEANIEMFLAGLLAAVIVLTVVKAFF